MIYASCRHDFDSDIFLAPLQLHTESGDTLTLPQLRDMVAGHTVDIFVHGYHNEMEGAIRAYQTMGARLDADSRTAGAIRIGFFWPGSFAKLGFSFAVARAKRSGAELAVLLDVLRLAGCKVTVETHSLGARVALDALKVGPNIDCLLLTAPAVDYDSLGLGGEFQDAIWKPKRFTVMHSNRDSVLKYAYRALNWFTPALGLVGPQRPRPLRVTTIDLTEQVAEHGGYKSAEGTYDPGCWRLESVPMARAAAATAR